MSDDINEVILRATMIDVDGVMRSRHNSDFRSIDISDDGLRSFWRWFGDSSVVDAHGRPLVVYHGTAADFDTFSHDAHRTVLNDQYHGDGFHFSPDEEVAQEYSTANRNQSFNKARMFEAVDREMPAELASLFRAVVEVGYEAAWELPDEQIRHLLALSERAKVDINSLLDLAEYVENTQYNLGKEQFFDAGMIFGSGRIYLPEWAEKSAAEFGLGDAVPKPRVVCSYLKADKVLITDNQTAAGEAALLGYDGVLYQGPSLVKGVPEWVVYDPLQIKSIDDLGRWLSDDPRYQISEGAKNLTLHQARRTLCDADENGKNAGLERDEFDPTEGHDRSGWILVKLPLSLIRPNDDGECYDSTTDVTRAEMYAQNPIQAPIHALYGERSQRNGTLTAGVNDGGHRVSAARLRGDETIPAIMQRSQYRLLLKVNGLTCDPAIDAAISRKKAARPQ